MKLPVYDSPQTAVQPVPDVSINPMLFRHIPNPMETFGGAMSQVAGEVARVTQNAQDQADQIQAEAALNQVQQQVIDQKAQAEQVRGADVLNVNPYGKGMPQNIVSAGLDTFDGTAQSVAEGLKNDQQKRMFNAGAQRLRLDLQGHLENHMLQEGFRSQEDTLDKTAALSVDAAAQAAQSGDIPAVAQQVSRADAAALQKSTLLGQTSPEEQQFNRLAATSPVHTAALGALLQTGQTQAATEYFNSPGVQDQMTAQARQGVQQIIQGKTDSDAGLGASARAWARFTAPAGPPDQDGNYPVPSGTQKNVLPPVADMVRSLDSLNLTPLARQIAEADLKDRVGLQQEQNRQQSTQALGSIFLMQQQGANKASIMSSSLFCGLDDGDKAKVLAGLNPPTDPMAQLKQQAALFDTLTAMNQTPGGPTGWLKAHEVNGDGGEKYLMALTPEVGPMGVKTLLQTRFDALNPSQGKPVPVTPYNELHGQVQEAWQMAGLIKPDPTEAEKKKMEDFVAYLQRTQQNSGQQWSLENTQKLIKEKTQNVVTGHPWFGSPTTEPLWQVEDKQEVPAWYLAAGRNAGLSNADAAQSFFSQRNAGAFNYDAPNFKRYAADATAYMAKIGQPAPALETIQRMWFMKNQGGTAFKGLDLTAPNPSPALNTMR